MGSNTLVVAHTQESSSLGPIILPASIGSSATNYTSGNSFAPSTSKVDQANYNRHSSPIIPTNSTISISLVLL